IALDVTAAPARPGKPAGDRAREPGAGDAAEARIRLASLVDREWLRPSAIRVEHFFDEASETVRAVEREYYGAIVLAERQAEPDPAEAARLLAIGYRRRGLRPDDEQLLRRLRFAGLEQDLEPLLAVATIGKRALDEVDLSEGLSWEVRQALIRDAPVSLTIPGGRTVRLEYRADGSVMASVKLQALFGLAETPRIGRRQEPVLLALLAPNGRPVQLTRDLRSFWERTYPEVRKELRGRYPKHAWPEHP
ncbi:MAG TPA: ATP-dependent helicase C-terminal domain-containing protein, partial [Gemmatimonadaceae bacterium]